MRVRIQEVLAVEQDANCESKSFRLVINSARDLAVGTSSKGDVMSVTKIIEVVGRSSVSSDDAVKSALAEASRTLRNVKALDVVSIGLRGDNLDEWGALVRISFLVDNLND